ncbi:MAG: wax ester/triacylglycerol synthase domain-containing protein [Oceanococcus sp.]
MRLNPLQAGWLMLESKATPMHMGGLLYFQLPKKAAEDYVQQLVARLRNETAVQAPWNKRLSRAGLLRPVWVDDDPFDLDYHLRHSALPAPGGERQIGELVSRLHGHRMDLRKPPWELHIIEGLHGGRFAIYFKIHPVMLDGAGVMQAMQGLLNSDGDADQLSPVWCQRQASKRAPSSLLSNWPALLRAGSQQLRSGLSLSRSWTGIKRVPRSALNDRLSSPRRFATQQYSTDRLRKAAKYFGANEEEMLYYLISSALRRFFREYNALPADSLVALLADRSRPDGMLSPLFFPLGTQYADREKRMTTIRDALRKARRQFSVLSGSDARAEATVDTLPYLIRQALKVDHRLAPLFNIGLVRMDLGEKTLYLGDAKLDAIFPMPMLLQGGAMNVACMRYGTHWHVGLSGARELLPHLQRMAVYMGLSLEELEAMNDEQAA